MPKAVKTFVFKVQCYGMDCFGTYFTHAQSCENLRVQSATERTASVHILHMPKAVITFMLKVLWMGCFGTYFTHAQSCDNVCVQRATEWTASVNTLHMPKSVIRFVFIMLRNTCPNLSCDHVFKVLRNGLLRYILHTCPKVGKPSCSKCYRKFCFRT